MTSATPANEYVADTIALVLRLEQRRIGQMARRIFEQLEAGNTTVYVPGIVFAEVMYLSHKGRIAPSLTEVDAYMRQYPNCKEYPLGLSVVQAAESITDIPELHDRLIAGTALHLGLPLVTSDATIQRSSFVTTIW